MKYIGIYPICNFGGLAIISIDPGSDICYSCFDFGNGPKNERRTRILYSGSGRPYIRRYNRRYYFDEIIKTEV